MQRFIELWTLIDDRIRPNGSGREVLMVDHDAPTGAMMAVEGNEGLKWGLAEGPVHHPKARRFLSRARVPTDVAVECLDRAVVGGGWYRCREQANVRGELV